MMAWAMSALRLCRGNSWVQTRDRHAHVAERSACSFGDAGKITVQAAMARHLVMLKMPVLILSCRPRARCRIYAARSSTRSSNFSYSGMILLEQSATGSHRATFHSHVAAFIREDSIA